MYGMKPFEKYKGHSFKVRCRHHGKTLGFGYDLMLQKKKKVVIKIGEVYVCANKVWPYRGRRCGREVKLYG